MLQKYLFIKRIFIAAIDFCRSKIVWVVLSHWSFMLIRMKNTFRSNWTTFIWIGCKTVEILFFSVLSVDRNCVAFQFESNRFQCNTINPEHFVRGWVTYFSLRAIAFMPFEHFQFWLMHFWDQQMSHT